MSRQREHTLAPSTPPQSVVLHLPRAGSNLDTLEHYAMSACVSVWQLNAQEEDLPAVPYVKAAVMRLFEDDPQGYTKRLDTAFSVQNIVEELHYQHSDEAVRTVLNDMSGRAEPFVEQRDEGGSDDYYLKRGGGGGAEGGGDGAEE